RSVIIACLCSHISPLSLHDALPIYDEEVRDHLERRREHLRQHQLILPRAALDHDAAGAVDTVQDAAGDLRFGGDALVEILERRGDRKSTRLNSSHQIISYAVFFVKK